MVINKDSSILTLLAAFFIVISLSGCFSHWQGDMAKIVISFGGAGRVAYDPNDTETHQKLDHSIILTSATETLEFSSKGSATFEAYVAPGNWNIKVDSCLDGEIYATGSKDVVLKLGQNYETIIMYEARLTARFEWLSTNAVDGGDYIFTVDKDETLAPQNLSYSGKKISITLKGDTQERIVSLSGNGSLFTINTGVTLILDNNITLRGLASNNASLIMINDGGMLVMNAGAGITDNTISDKWQAGVYIKENATFVMNGGEISGIIAQGGGAVWVEGNFAMNKGKIYNNKSTENSGAGVWAYKAGVFAMSDGEISGNTAYMAGGGVQAYNGGTFNMSGGTISGNTVRQDDGSGGGVSVSGGTFNMSGGKISGNTAQSGGGVNVYQGSFTMSGGEISGNTTTGYGGGGVNVSGIFTMSGGKISGNTAQSGGGVYVWEGSFTMSGGEISSNTTTEYGGGGVNIDGNGTSFEMKGGTISGNKSSSWGGGVFVWEGTFTMTDGEIHDNEVFESGGGVTVWEGTFTMIGGKIHDNKAITSGAAGVDVLSNSIFTMTGGEICNNTGFGGDGGGVGMSGGTFKIGGGTISGNTAKSGGGVCIYEGTFTMTDGEISKNTATDGFGGGVFIGFASEKFTKTGGTIYGYSANDENSNVVKRGNVVEEERGHAVFVDFDPVKRRDTIAGPTVSLDSGNDANWDN